MGSTTTTRPTVKCGDIFAMPVMDTMVRYKVERISGERVTASAVPDPIEIDGTTIPGDFDGTVRDFLIDDVAARVAQQRAASAANARAADSDAAFWALRDIGDVLHHHVGGNAWVRGVVTNRDGTKMFKPTALVGTWAPYDLPTRRGDGTINVPYHPAKIAAGEIWKPAVWSLWEGETSYVLRYASPVDLPDLDLTVPEPTAAEAAEHAREALLAQIATIAHEYSTPSTHRLAQIHALVITEAPT